VETSQSYANQRRSRCSWNEDPNLWLKKWVLTVLIVGWLVYVDLWWALCLSLYLSYNIISYFIIWYDMILYYIILYKLYYNYYYYLLLSSSLLYIIIYYYILLYIIIYYYILLYIII
jgi:hypothetical protein